MTILTSLADRIRAKSVQNDEIGLLEWSQKYIPHYFDKGFSEVHHTLCRTADELKFNRKQRRVVIVPRGYAKSTFCSFAMPLKAICEGSERFILLCADTSDMAVKYVKSIRAELETNEGLAKKYPMACTKGDSWSDEYLITASGVCIAALGKGKNARGIKYRQFRPTLIVLDDPQSDDDVRSPTMREKDINWLNRALIPCGDTNTNYFVVGNNLHRKSMVGILADRPDFITIKFSAVMKWSKEEELWKMWRKLWNQGNKDECLQLYLDNKEVMTAGTQVLWDEKENYYDLMCLRASIGDAAFDAEKQNNPRDPTKSEFPEEWFSDAVMYDELPDEKLVSVGYCDPSKGLDTKRGDYNPIITGHYCPAHRCCYLECDIRKIPLTELTSTIVEWYKQVRYVAFGCESNGFQSLVADELFAKLQAEGIIAPNIIGIENYGVHKNTRISRLSIWFQRGFFRFKRNCPYTKILLEQAQDHPNSDHDDGPDALEGLVRLLTSVHDLGDSDQIQDDSAVGDDGLGTILTFN
jgi:predicted phage terminase large subunit-like protein